MSSAKIHVFRSLGSHGSADILAFQTAIEVRTLKFVTGLLSIVWRELAVGARQTSTQRARIIAGGIVVGIFILFLIAQSGPPQQVGRMLFGISAFLLFAQALLSGVRYTADALSEEKREGTLGLLFLTPLRSGEVVLGKLIVRSLRGVYALIATLPVFTFCMLFGGVRGMDAVHMALLLVSTMVFSLSACIYVSSRCTEDKSAFLGSLGILAAFAFVPPILWKICYSIAPRVGWDFILYPSPAFAYGALPSGGSSSGNFFASIGVMWVLAAVFVAMGSLELGRSFKAGLAEAFPQKPKPAGQREKEQAEWILWRSKRSRLDEAPFTWLLRRDRFYPKLSAWFATVALAGCLIGWVLISNVRFGFWMAVFVYGLYGLHVVWKTLVSSYALRRLHEDHRSGALEILLTTPLPVEEIVHGQVKQTRRLFLGGALALALGNVALMLNLTQFEPIMLPIGATIFLFVDGHALIWMSIREALRSSRYPVAVLRVAGVTLLPPMLAFMVVMFAVRGFGPGGFNAFFLIWYVGCWIYDVILLRRAKGAVISRFRELASEGAVEARRVVALPKPLQWLLLKEVAPTEPAAS